MNRKLFIVVICAFIVAGSGFITGAGTNGIEYPDKYRNWTHVKSMVILPGHPLEDPFMGIHHIYANKTALEGYRSGKFGKGSVIVFDLLEYKKDENTIQEDNRKLIGVMVKNEEKYPDTGGWGFEGFAGDSKTERLTSDGGQSCFACHTSQKEKDYVFSEFRN